MLNAFLILNAYHIVQWYIMHIVHSMFIFIMWKLVFHVHSVLIIIIHPYCIFHHAFYSMYILYTPCLSVCQCLHVHICCIHSLSPILIILCTIVSNAYLVPCIQILSYEYSMPLFVLFTHVGGYPSRIPYMMNVLWNKQFWFNFIHFISYTFVIVYSLWTI